MAKAQDWVKGSKKKADAASKNDPNLKDKALEEARKRADEAFKR